MERSAYPKGVKFASSASTLGAKAGKQVENQGQNDADKNGSSQRKKDCKTLSPVGQIAGQASHRHSEPSSQQHKHAHYNEETSDTEKRFAQFIHRKPPGPDYFG
jgi:hypothetical protein